MRKLQYAAHPAHTTRSTWLSWNLVERQSSKEEGIITGGQPLKSPQGKSKKA